MSNAIFYAAPTKATAIRNNPPESLQQAIPMKCTGCNRRVLVSHTSLAETIRAGHKLNKYVRILCDVCFPHEVKQYEPDTVSVIVPQRRIGRSLRRQMVLN